MLETDQSEGVGRKPAWLVELGRSISAKLMLSILLAGLSDLRPAGLLEQPAASQAPGGSRLGERRAAKRGAAPQRLALHAQQRPQRPLRNDGQHGRPARHCARPHSEFRGCHQLFHAAVRSRCHGQQERRSVLRLSRAVQAADHAQAVRPLSHLSRRHQPRPRHHYSHREPSLVRQRCLPRSSCQCSDSWRARYQPLA